MSGMLHPVGPEPARTYWVRRGILLAVVLLVGLGIVLAVASLTKAAVATAPPPVIAPAGTPSASAPNPQTSSATATPASSASSSATSAAGTPPVATSATPRPSASPAESAPASTVPSASTSAAPSSAPTPKATPKAKTTPNAKAAPVGTPDCRPSDLTATLKGDRTLSPGENNTFKVGLVNGGAQTCLLSVTDKNFELKVYSGKDRIWSSRDCAKVLKDFDKKLANGAVVAWTMSWNGERSVAGKSCKTSGDTPRPGTYWATAQLEGAEPVQLRMIIA